jgi:hypothetical protein
MFEEIKVMRFLIDKLYILYYFGIINRGVKGKSHVSNRKVICLEIEIDPF